MGNKLKSVTAELREKTICAGKSGEYRLLASPLREAELSGLSM
jgi:hypothetical protein